MKQYEPFVIFFGYKNGKIEVGVIPIAVSKDKMPETFEIIVNGKSYGLIHYLKEQWISSTMTDKSLVKTIGSCIYKIYENGEILSQKLLPEKLPYN